MKKKFRLSRIFMSLAAFACALSLFLSGCNLFSQKHEHKFVNYVYNDDATCLNDGTETAKCEGCDETHTRVKEGTKKKHEFIFYVSNNDATCTENGTETAKCENCHMTDTREEQDSKKAHSFVSYASNGDATCTENGTETAKCEHCDATDTREEKDSKKPHSFVNYKSNNDATCTKNGTETGKCERCGATNTREIPDSKKPHSFTNYIPNGDATQEADGTKTAKCDNCDAINTVTDEGSKLSGDHVHSYKQTVVPPTCTEKGYTLYKCDCGEAEYKDDFVASKGHSFTNYVSDNNATCTKNCTETAKCDRCEETDTREIPDSKKPHSFTNYVSNGDATEDKDGTKTAKCDNCDATDTVTDVGSKLPPNGKPAEGSLNEIGDAKLSIHFLELGNKYTGDCTLIKCGNTEVLIDAGSRKDSAATIKTYVDKYCTDGVLEYVIATHAHQDHIAGFVGNSINKVRNGILYKYKIGTLIQFAGHNATTQIYDDYCTAVEYAASRGTTVYTAKQCWYETDGAKKQYFLDENKTVSMNILYNYYYDNTTDDENDYSVCMLLSNVEKNKTYNYLFTGDLEAKGEQYLVENNTLPEVELFKGGHHGSYTASTDRLLSVIKPKNIAICCCCGTTEYTTNTDNTFPAQASLDRMAKYTENIYCTTLIVDYAAGEYTSMNGNIVFYYKDRFKLYCTNNSTVLKDTDWFKNNRKWNP